MITVEKIHKLLKEEYYVDIINPLVDDNTFRESFRFYHKYRHHVLNMNMEGEDEMSSNFHIVIKNNHIRYLGECGTLVPAAEYD